MQRIGGSVPPVPKTSRSDRGAGEETEIHLQVVVTDILTENHEIDESRENGLCRGE